MRGAGPRALLFVLVVTVPVVVAAAFVVAVLLQRAGFGLVVWALVPFLVSMALIAALGVYLGRAATEREEQSPGDERRSRKDDGV